MPTYNPNANPSIFNLDIPNNLPPSTGQLGSFHLAGPVPGQSYTFSGNVAPRMGIGGVAGTGTGTTNYFLNGMPISGTALGPALDAIKAGNSTPFNTGLSGNTTAGMPNYQGMLQWLQQMNSPGMQQEQPIYQGVIGSPNWTP